LRTNFLYEFTKSDPGSPLPAVQQSGPDRQRTCNSERPAKLLARRQADRASSVAKGALLMIKLGKVSVETRGDKTAPWGEVSQEPEIFI
jgi:hypothetical protein